MQKEQGQRLAYVLLWLLHRRKVDFSHPSDATHLDGMLGLPRDGGGGQRGSAEGDLALGRAMPRCPAEPLRGLWSTLQGNLRGGACVPLGGKLLELQAEPPARG